MFDRIKNNIASRISPTGKHISGLRSDLRSRLGHFRRHRSVSEQGELTEDFSHVLTAWGIDGVTAIPGVIRALCLRFMVFAVPMAVCVIAALLLQNLVSCLALAFITLPCLLGIVTTAWRISILESRCFLSLSRWLLSFAGLSGDRP